MSAHQKALDKAKIQLMSTPDTVFFITVCFSLKHIWDNDIPTACTDGYEIRYNPDFFMSLTTDEQVFLLLHETLHVVFQHMVRLGSRNARKWIVAADYVINALLIERGFKMPEGGLYDPQYSGMGTEEVYDLLPDDPEPPPMEDLEPSDSTTKGPVKDHIDDILVKAQLQSQMAGNTAGSIPGQVQFYIKSLLQPKLPWHQLLKGFFSKTIKRGYTWTKPNKRYFPRMHLPSRNSKALCHIVVAIDTSASVTDDQFHRFVSEVYSILKRQNPTSLTLIQFDTQIRSVSEITSPRDLLNLQFSGRGGTDIEDIVVWAKEHKPTVMLAFTDGQFGQRRASPGIPWVWLINDNPRFRARWGTTIHFSTDDDPTHV